MSTTQTKRARFVWVRGIALIGAIITLIVTFLTVLPNARRCDLSLQFGTDLLCDPPTLTPKPSPTPILPGMVLLDENFQRPTSVRVTTGGDGTTWRIVSDETGNRVYQVDARNRSNPAFDFALWDWGDYAITYRFRVLEGNNNAFISTAFRMHDYAINRCCAAYIFNIDAAINRAALLISDNGPDWTLIQGKNFELQSDVWYNIRIQTYRNRIDVYINAELFISVNDSRITKGAISWGAGSGILVQFDDVRVLATGS